MTTVSKAPHAPRGKSGLLADCAQELFGSTYIIGLARLSGVATKTVRRWLDGAHPIPAYVWDRVSGACTAKITRLKRVELAAHGRFMIEFPTNGDPK